MVRVPNLREILPANWNLFLLLLGGPLVSLIYVFFFFVTMHLISHLKLL